MQNFRAYRDREENNCYIEKLVDDVAKQELIENEIQRKQTSKILYAPNEPLTKFEVRKRIFYEYSFTIVITG